MKRTASLLAATLAFVTVFCLLNKPALAGVEEGVAAYEAGNPASGLPSPHMLPLTAMLTRCLRTSG